MKTAVLIPCYNVALSIEKVITTLPESVDAIIAVNDASKDNTLEVLHELANRFPKLTVVDHEVNAGVGGAMKTGFKTGLTTDCSVFVKMDGDGQMNADFIPALERAADKHGFSKGNRFHDLQNLVRMPLVRRIGNLGLGFLIKSSSGFWNISDPTNGYIAISRSILERVDMERLENRFFFESSLLIELYYAGAEIEDIPMPAIYGEETSNLSVSHSLFSFPPKLFKAFVGRILKRYFLYDFNIGSIFISTGLSLFLFGVIFGAVKWASYSALNLPAPTGTIVLSMITTVLGFQLLLSAVHHDIENGKFKN